jgi:hypothetical protein
MYRILPISKDTYLTNKIIAGSGSTSSNVGQAGTLDLYKIWTLVTSGSTPTVETSRLLVQPDLDPLRSLTGSLLNIADSSFKCYLSLKDVYGGQTTPSNFAIVLNPLSKSWDEGRGRDVRLYRDLDSANWVTASVDNGTPSTWAVTGAAGSGTDYLPAYEVKQTFARGDENLLMDVTSIVSATLAGVISDYGWRLAYSSSYENDESTYFVKRFGSRHTSNLNLHPKLIVTYGDTLEDSGSQAVFGQTNKIRTYNKVNGAYSYFYSGSQAVTGSDSLMLVMVASKSVNITTSSYETNFSASITYTTSSYSYFSSSFSASLSSIGNLPLVGYYEAAVGMNPQLTSSLATFLGSDKSAVFQTYWKSLDGTVLYSSGSWMTFTLPQSGETVSSERNFVVNVTNLKEEYVQDQTVRFRVFVQDRNTEQPALRLPTPAKSFLFGAMYWRLLNAFSREVVIPFHSTGTKMSSDGFGRYFDMYMEDLDPQVVYELEFQITEAGRDYFITNQGFRFKVVP